MGWEWMWWDMAVGTKEVVGLVCVDGIVSRSVWWREFYWCLTVLFRVFLCVVVLFLGRGGGGGRVG